MTAATWIMSVLKDSTTVTGKVSTRIFRDSAPEGTGFPFIVFQQVDMVPVYNLFKDALMDNERWQIKVVDKGNSYTDIDIVAGEIIALLHKKSASGIVSATLEFYFPQTETDAGATYKSGILQFRIHTQ